MTLSTDRGALHVLVAFEPWLTHQQDHGRAPKLKRDSQDQRSAVTGCSIP
jgi:hypothetical protein